MATPLLVEIAFLKSLSVVLMRKAHNLAAFYVVLVSQVKTSSLMFAQQ